MAITGLDCTRFAIVRVESTGLPPAVGDRDQPPQPSEWTEDTEPRRNTCTELAQSCVQILGHNFDDPANRTAINFCKPRQRRWFRRGDDIVAASLLIRKTPN